jgi:hypothetical protein
LAGAEFRYTQIPFGMHRRHLAQKSNNGLQTTRTLIPIAMRFASIAGSAGSISSETRDSIREELQAYLTAYPEKHWRRSGRLARWGLPRVVVTRLRNAKSRLSDVFGF